MPPNPTPPSSRYDASQAADDADWFDRLDEICAEEGYYEPIGARHHAFFADESPTLIVSFDTLQATRARPRQMPFALTVAELRGWSHLAIIAEGETWFREQSLYRYFDRLVDEAFFDDFDRVVFYGAGMGGYAACAFSVAAPGSTVVAVSPRATLDPSVAGWDRRDLVARRLNFNDRYGYAPDMIEAAERVFVLHDPYLPEDAMHAALFRGPHVSALRTRYLGDAVEPALIQIGLMPDLLLAAGDGRLTPEVFHRGWRARRHSPTYVDGLVADLEVTGRLRAARELFGTVDPSALTPGLRAALARLEREAHSSSGVA